MSVDCIFCGIAEKKIPAKIVFEEKDVIAFEDVNPQAPVHLLVISRTHVESIDALEEKQLFLISRMVDTAKKLAKERKITKGYRLVFNNGREAGQSVFHIHLHVLGGRPMRWPPG